MKWGIGMLGVIVAVERRDKRGSIQRWWAIAIERQSLLGSNRAVLSVDLRVPTAVNREGCCDSHVAALPRLHLAPLVGLRVRVRRVAIVVQQSQDSWARRENQPCDSEHLVVFWHAAW